MNLTTITAPSGARFTVAAPYAKAFTGLLGDLDAAGYGIKGDQSGGYNPRFIAGTRTPSQHSYGRAIDINWTDNARGTPGNIPPDLARSLAAKYGLTWGGDWKNPDAMHFEIGPNGPVAVPDTPQRTNLAQNGAISGGVLAPVETAALAPQPQQETQQMGILSKPQINPQEELMGILGDTKGQAPWQMLTALGAGIAGGADRGWGPGIGAGLTNAANVQQQGLGNRINILGALLKAQGSGLTDDTKEYGLYRQQELLGGREPKSFFDYQTTIKSAGTPQQTVNVGGEKIPPDLIKAGIEGQKTADSLSNQVEEIRTFRDMAMDAKTGPLTPVTLPIQQAFRQLGISVGKDVPLFEALQAQQNQLALRLRNPESGFGLTGNTSNQDVRFLKESVAGLEKTPEGNHAVLTIMLAKQRRSAELERLKADFIFENGTLKGWTEARNKWVDANPFFTPEEAQFLQGLRQGNAAVPKEPAGPPRPASDGGQPDADGWKTVNGVRIRMKP